MPSPLTHSLNVLASYLRGGEASLARIADRLHRTADRRPGGKFDKSEAVYLPQSPFPPLLWRPECERCRFYEDGEPGEPATCHLVGRPDDRWGGEAIHPRGWCAYYLPPAGEPAFTWLRERLRPSGAASVRGQYRPPFVQRGIRSESRERERSIPVTERGRGAGGGNQDGGT